jgi:hypothetical protein
MEEELSWKNTFELFFLHKELCIKRREIYENMTKKQRQPNFPEDVSENIVRQAIILFEYVDCKWNIPRGDLKKIDKFGNITKIEVKCFSSTGPSSFGPNETWDELYFLDGTKFMSNHFKIYKIKLSNTDDLIQKFPLNKDGTTFGQQCIGLRRPRFLFKQLMTYIPEHIEVIFSGTINENGFCSDQSLLLKKIYDQIKYVSDKYSQMISDMKKISHQLRHNI